MHVQDHILEFSKSFPFDGSFKKPSAVRSVCPKLATDCQNLKRFKIQLSPSRNHWPAPYPAPILGSKDQPLEIFDQNVKMLAPYPRRNLADAPIYGDRQVISGASGWRVTCCR